MPQSIRRKSRNFCNRDKRVLCPIKIRSSPSSQVILSSCIWRWADHSKQLFPPRLYFTDVGRCKFRIENSVVKWAYEHEFFVDNNIIRYFLLLIMYCNWLIYANSRRDFSLRNNLAISNNNIIVIMVLYYIPCSSYAQYSTTS